ncbi:unnamed protein product [Eruca vesicaria subsp. sativa]|uniref:Large ribosomal subunit protein eL19 domain-containing protein n=1 Tax=Eruca vesicaria subsp. sativa TaxID=29727 RepID=A0ABC8K664_ERUVS|nr:unnamed protein product [Eruca vesicaria subsp. sativa]
MKDGFIIRKPSRIHSRACAMSLNEENIKGCHSGYSKRNSIREAKLGTKVLLWITRMSVLRRSLSKFREANKIDEHVYHDMYIKAKCNVFKNKCVLQVQGREDTL